MPRDIDRGEALLQITTRGLRKYEGLFRQAQRDLLEGNPGEFGFPGLRDTIEEIGVSAVFVLQARAPERTGRLKESIRITGRNRSTTRPNIRVGGVARSRSDPRFNYIPVTRFGRGPVEAKGRGGIARSYATKAKGGRRGVQRRPWRASMLKFEPGPPGSGFIYRRRVGPYRPRRDWVKTAEVQIRKMAEEFMEEFSENVERYFEFAHRGGGRLGGPRRVSTKRFR